MNETDGPIDSETSSPENANPAQRRRFVRPVALAAIVVTGIVIAAQSTREPVPPIPELNVDGIKPQVADVLAQARQEVEDDPDDALTWARFGLLLRGSEFLYDAAYCFEQATKLDPTESFWPYMHGLSIFRNDFEAGIACFSEAIRLDPNRVDVRLQLSEALLDQHRGDVAESHIKSALRIEPNNAQAWQQMARVEFLRGQWGRCRDYAARSAAIEPTKPQTHALLAQALHRLGDSEQAAFHGQAADSFSHSTPWPNRELQRADELLHEKNWFIPSSGRSSENSSATIASAENDAQASPEKTWSHLKFAATLIAAGQNDQAAEVVDEGLKHHPASAELYLQRGIIDVRRDRLEQAAESFGHALKLKSDYAEASFNLGLCLRLLGDTQGAIDAYRQVIRVQPASASAHVSLGQLLVETGSSDMAMEHARIAIKLAPEDPDAKALLRQLEKNPDTTESPSGANPAR